MDKHSLRKSAYKKGRHISIGYLFAGGKKEGCHLANEDPDVVDKKGRFRLSGGVELDFTYAGERQVCSSDETRQYSHRRRFQSWHAHPRL
ncbi:hypothetical protein AVEN_37003-1 [Araneus ventricosus]|uniref:Uncharacterized protein n=1 Tax=Araneus ventricosus TaxID=182803 RepID=A0A4Y2KSJ0_ARAVE|nr:hypothetical protein AVEN_37003-1 [Araneus ventricosus]